MLIITGVWSVSDVLIFSCVWSANDVWITSAVWSAIDVWLIADMWSVSDVWLISGVWSIRDVWVFSGVWIVSYMCGLLLMCQKKKVSCLVVIPWWIIPLIWMTGAFLSVPRYHWCASLSHPSPVLLPLLISYQCYQQSGDWWLFCHTDMGGGGGITEAVTTALLTLVSV